MGGSRQEVGASRDRQEGTGADTRESAGEGATQEGSCGLQPRGGGPSRDPRQTLKKSKHHHSHGHLQEQTHDSLGGAGSPDDPRCSDAMQGWGGGQGPGRC